MTRDAIITDLKKIGEKSWERTVCDLAASLIENQAKELDALTIERNALNALLQKRWSNGELGLRWTSVDDALPTDSVSVLGYMPAEAPLPTVHECYHTSDGWYAHSRFESAEVTHWMPMPRFEGDEDGE